MAFIKGTTTNKDDFVFRADEVAYVEQFDDDINVGVIIGLKSGKSFRTYTYDLDGAKDAIGI